MNICDDIYQCESTSDPICSKLYKICDGNGIHKNQDCPNRENELRCQVGRVSIDMGKHI